MRNEMDIFEAVRQFANTPHTPEEIELYLEGACAVLGNANPILHRIQHILYNETELELQS